MIGTTVHIPTLETGRLILRAPATGDFEAYAEMMTSSRACYMDQAKDRNAAWNWFVSDVAHWSLFGFGALMIDVRGSGLTVGEVSINNGPTFPETEIGWLLYEGSEGQGYATEAAGALRDWAFTSTGLTTLVSYIDPENRTSIRLAERLGAVADPDAERRQPRDLVFRHSKPEDV